MSSPEELSLAQEFKKIAKIASRIAGGYRNPRREKYKQAWIKLNEEELRNHLASKLAAFKVPEYITISDSPLERNAAGKLLVNAIKEKSAHYINKFKN